MKKIYTIAIMAAAAAMFASCQKEMPLTIELQSLQVDQDSFVAMLDNSTKTTIDSLTVQWQKTDSISVNGVIYKVDTVDEANPAKALFKKAHAGDAAPAAPFYAYFPAGMYDASTGKTALLEKAPSLATKDSFNMPMAAYTCTRTMSFHNICGVLKVNVEKTGRDTLRVSADIPVSGEFTIDDFSAPVAEIAQEGVKSNEVVFPLAGQTGEFYIPLPAGDYSGKNLRVSIQKAGSAPEYMTTRQDAAISIAVNNIYPFSFAQDFSIGFFKTITVVEQL